MTSLKQRVILLALTAFALVPTSALARLQCVPYARDLSGVDIRGNAKTWWGQAEGRYERGSAPRRGAVMAFKGTAAMPLGHVAYVADVIGPREVLLHHANWSRPGGIERAVRAIDVSEAGDWSQVRVWHSPTGTMGLRINPVFGFIYNDRFSVDAPFETATIARQQRTLLAGEVYKLAVLEASPSR